MPKYTETTDAYFERVEETLDYANKNPLVTAEVTADQFPDGESEVYAGLDEALEILEGLPVTVETIPEGTLIDGGPVMNIHGRYRGFARYETPLLGVLSHASGIATRAAKVVQRAGETPVYSFGSRHVHPKLAHTLERSAYIGGVAGYSNIAADLPIEPTGTMPHALMLSFQDTYSAWRSFNNAVDDDIPRIVLVDTFTDEVDETLKAVYELGDDLDAVRLDTTGSRRGNFKHIIKEVRYHLDKNGRPDVDIIVSGGLGAEEVYDLHRIVDGFGVGGYISDANPVDFSLDIVEVNGTDACKRGKLPGVKDLGVDPVIIDGELQATVDVEMSRLDVQEQLQDEIL